MTHLKGMTIAQFKDIVEDMRKVYPFTDDNAKIIDTHDVYTASNTLLEINTYDEETGVNIHLSKGLTIDEW